MRTQLTIAASLIVAVVLSAGIPAFDVVAAGQRGDDGETRRYSVDSDGGKPKSSAWIRRSRTRSFVATRHTSPV